jgi:demethylmenaquinone methyltransferase / 2-methoxy-6-polyprenyl-1,4-benzoquinol methylase
LSARVQATGASPAEGFDEKSSAAAIQEMFNSIAPRYDLLNHVLSCNIDRLWWWKAARRFRHVLVRPEAQVLDICCGTGDMTLALLKRRPAKGAPVIAADFSHAMLSRGAEKLRGHNAVVVEADALHLPIAPDSLALVTSAFGFRNLANYDAGLREFHRVLGVGGELGILDFSEPGGMLGKLYAFYFRRVLPAIGSRISGMGSAYQYLPSSVERFPAPEKMMELMRACGYEDVSWTPYSFGIAGLYRGVKRRV